MMVSKNKKVELFIDSGAFSAWTQGAEIDINDYIDFIKKHESLITVYANLDVIGIGGKQPNAETARKTLQNQKIMEAAGLCPLPCFHFGEPFRYLLHYVNKYKYIALGVAGNKGTKLIPWLDQCFGEYICDENGYPRVKVHGFAVTSLPIMIRYPWYSVDSTSWALTGGMGAVYIPRYKDNEWVYDENSWKIFVSNRNPKRKDAGQHFDTMSPSEQDVVLNYIHQKGYVMGKSEFKMVESTYKPKDNERWTEAKPKDGLKKRELEIIIEPGLSNKFELRDELNIIYFHDLEASLPEWPWPFKQSAKHNLF